MNGVQAQKQNLHAMLLALAYLGDDLKRNDIGVVKSTCVLQGHKYTFFVLHALSLDTNHTNVRLFMTDTCIHLSILLIYSVIGICIY